MKLVPLVAWHGFGWLGGLHLMDDRSLAGRAVEYSKDVSGLAEAVKAIPDADADKRLLRQVYASSLKIVWVVMCALAALGLIGSLFVRHVSLPRDHKTK
ncbi:unnamed protein product [Neofusicoccum parvum]|uniref:Unnamed protein product n=1 Tax=Neofusicoccum parvum TaxID=310453 RepID=A0ACB5RWK3_9PEZI|nr:unnamed protein product [Neofusicoccum parvum]